MIVIIAIVAGFRWSRRAQDVHGGYEDREDDEGRHYIVIAQKSVSFRRWR